MNMCLQPSPRCRISVELRPGVMEAIQRDAEADSVRQQAWHNIGRQYEHLQNWMLSHGLDHKTGGQNRKGRARLYTEDMREAQ